MVGDGRDDGIMGILGFACSGLWGYWFRALSWVLIVRDLGVSAVIVRGFGEFGCYGFNGGRL